MLGTQREVSGRWPFDETRKFIGQDFRNPLHGMDPRHALLIQDMDYDKGKNLVSRRKYVEDEAIKAYPPSGEFNLFGSGDAGTVISIVDAIMLDKDIVYLVKFEAPLDTAWGNTYAFIHHVYGEAFPHFVTNYVTGSALYVKMLPANLSSRFKVKGSRVYWSGNAEFTNNLDRRTAFVFQKKPDVADKRLYCRNLGVGAIPAQVKYSVIAGGTPPDYSTVNDDRKHGYHTVYLEALVKDPSTGNILSSTGPQTVGYSPSWAVTEATKNDTLPTTEYGFNKKVCLNSFFVNANAEITHFRVWVSGRAYDPSYPAIEGFLQTQSYFQQELTRAQLLANPQVDIGGVNHYTMNDIVMTPAVFSNLKVYSNGDGSPATYTAAEIDLVVFPQALDYIHTGTRFVFIPSTHDTAMSDKIVRPQESVLFGYQGQSVYLEEMTSLANYRSVHHGKYGTCNAMVMYQGDIYIFKTYGTTFLYSADLENQPFQECDTSHGVWHPTHVYSTSAGILAYCSDDTPRATVGKEPLKPTIGGIDISVGLPIGMAYDTATSTPIWLSWATRDDRVLVMPRRTGLLATSTEVHPAYALHLYNFGGWTTYTMGEVLQNIQWSPGEPVSWFGPMMLMQGPSDNSIYTLLWMFLITENGNARPAFREVTTRDNRDLSDTSNLFYGWKIITSPWATPDGRDMIEMHRASLLARVDSISTLKFGAYVNTRDDANKVVGTFNPAYHMQEMGDMTPMFTNIWADAQWGMTMPEWADYNERDIDPDFSVAETEEYMYYPQPKTPYRSRIYAQRIGLAIYGSTVAMIHDIKLHGFRQRNVRKASQRPEQVTWDSLEAQSQGVSFGVLDIVDMDNNNGGFN